MGSNLWPKTGFEKYKLSWPPFGPKNGTRSLQTIYLKAVKYMADRVKKREHLQSIVYEIEFLKL